MLEKYVKAMNKIDDYFEYSCKSKEDQAYVHKVLAELTKSLKEMPIDKDV